MNHRHLSRRYDRLYYVLSVRMERKLLKLISVLILLLVVYQILLQVPYFKKNVTYIDRMEGTPIQPESSTEREQR
ncbi:MULTISPECIES: hypothetical protein [Paenibacillus]|uniref:Uncharacterized protein n=1 Tax=Paenibacillus xylanilyticus TaxID=248903 RepID=A0A7Y6EWV5_9BACL|nr:hypothetical protein [Paenibacillus xylanilyticus]NUU78191.1 hypothetical protein [Paenibacillus xylanilyticus]